MRYELNLYFSVLAFFDGDHEAFLKRHSFFEEGIQCQVCLMSEDSFCFAFVKHSVLFH